MQDLWASRSRLSVGVAEKPVCKTSKFVQTNLLCFHTYMYMYVE